MDDNATVAPCDDNATVSMAHSIFDAPDIMTRILAHISGAHALQQLAAACTSLRRTFLPDAHSLWRQLWTQEFEATANAGLQQLAAVSNRWYEQYRRAWMLLTPQSARWVSQRGNNISSPVARQGGAGCCLELAGPGLVLVGGWTVNGIENDVHVLRCPRDSRSAQWRPQHCRFSQEMPETYGHAVTVVPDCGRRDLIVVSGGVCFGGYRGAIRHCRTLRINHSDETSNSTPISPSSPRVAVTEEQRGLLPHFTATADADDEQDVPDGDLYDAEWLQAFVLLDTARAYHTATYLGPDSGAHASNADSIW